MRSPVLLLSSLGLASVSAYQTNVHYEFDPVASGISGRIAIDYDPEAKSNVATISANLNFNKIDKAALVKADAKCKGKVTEYTWHIHTKWQQPATLTCSSAKFAQCARAITANHYDPYRACGPASDYVDSPECAGRVANYKCTPKNYKMDPWLCEVGDLSGKFGRFKPNKKGDVSATWVDTNFPTWLSHASGWNIVIHAVCGDATPRVACAYGRMLSHLKNKKMKALQSDDEQDDNQDDGEDDEADDADDKEVTHELATKNKSLRIQIRVKNDNEN